MSSGRRRCTVISQAWLYKYDEKSYNVFNFTRLYARNLTSGNKAGIFIKELTLLHLHLLHLRLLFHLLNS